MQQGVENKMKRNNQLPIKKIIGKDIHSVYFAGKGLDGESCVMHILTKDFKCIRLWYNEAEIDGVKIK